ncbi:MAG: helix-turn-helix domain-containing protein [Candidatus Aminicenantales bacterium]
MSQENIKKYFEILELSPNASLQEIKNAYMRLEKLYSSDSIVLAPLGEEFPKRMRKKILHQIEDAYTKLLLLNKGEFQKSRLPMDVYSFKIPSPDGQTECPSFSGKFLKEVREKLGIELSDISGQLKLRIELLKSVEEENFKDLPEEAYLKSHVKSLAACLSLPPDKAAEDYLKRYREWKNRV